MDFTFDNPFDDVFTDPNAPATVETAPVVVQPVQPAQPVYNPAVVAVQNPAPTAVVAPGPAVVQTTTNPGTTDYIAQTGSPVPQNPAVTPQQIYTASPVVQPPTLLQNNPTNPALLSTNGTQVSNQPNQVQTQQIQNPALIAPVMPQNPVQPVQTATPMQTAAQMPAQTTTQATTTVNEQTQPQTASVAPVTPEVTNPNDIWREAKAPNGRIYYYKKSTRETTWTKPASYIPLGGAAPISSTSGAAPAVAATPAVTTTPVTTTTSTNTPLTGFNLSTLSTTGTTPTSNPLAAENPALVGTNPALLGTNPALLGTNPALTPAGAQYNPALGVNPALSSSNQSLSNSSSSLGGSTHSQGNVAGGSPYGTQHQSPSPVPGQLNANPALDGIGASNPALSTSNPALTLPMHTSTPMLGQTTAVANPALGTGDAVVAASPTSNLANGTPNQQQYNNVQFNPATGQFEVVATADGQTDPNALQQASAPAPQMQQVQQVMYDANGQVMYDANGQVMYQIVEVPVQVPVVDPAAAANQAQYAMYAQQQTGQMGVEGAQGGMQGQGQLGSSNGVSTPVSAATSSAPATPTFPKTFRVRLPADQRHVVPFKQESTLRSVLTKICSSRGLSMDDYLAKDRSGMDINLDKTLGEINQEEISFLTPRAGVVPQDETKRKAHKLMSDIYEANAGLSSSLQAIIKNYRDPLLKSAQDVDMRKRLLSEQECNQIFASLESITSMTKDFMSHLSTQLSTWPVDLTEMITRHSEVLTFYNEFVSNYRANMNKLEDLRRNPDFAAFVDGVQRGLGSKLRLEDFMALPAVKIAATSTLIESLIGVLTDQHPNFFSLRDFHQRLQPIANQATSLRLQMEARSKIVLLEATIAKFPKKASFLHDQRIFFRDGLFELGTKKKPSLCYVALFTDLMIVCKAPEKKKKDKPATPPTFEEVISFGPSNCSVEEVGSQGWNLHIDAGKGKFTVNCSIHTSSEYSKADWVKAFRDAFHDFTGKPHLKPPVL